MYPLVDVSSNFISSLVTCIIYSNIVQVSSEEDSEVEEELNVSSSDEEDDDTSTTSIARVNSSDYFVLEFKDPPRKRVVSASPAVRVSSPRYGTKSAPHAVGGGSLTETQHVSNTRRLQ